MTDKLSRLRENLRFLDAAQQEAGQHKNAKFEVKAWRAFLSKNCSRANLYLMNMVSD